MLCTFQHLFEHLFPVQAIDKGNFQPCQFDVCRNQINALCMVQDAFTGRNTLIVHGFCHQGGKGRGQFIGLLPAHADGQAALWVSVHQQDFFAFHRQPDAQIFTGGGFAGTAFLVDDSDCGTFLCDKITPSANHAQSHGSFDFDRLAASWWVRYTEKRADIVSCFGLGCCSLQGTSAQNGRGRRSAS